MSAEKDAQFLFRYLTSVADGVVAISVARSSLLPACTLHFSRHGEEMRSVTGDHFQDAVGAMRKVVEP